MGLQAVQVHHSAIQCSAAGLTRIQRCRNLISGLLNSICEHLKTRHTEALEILECSGNLTETCDNFG